MDKVHVFLATPISGCADGAEYHDLRTRIIELIGRLRVEGFEVFSEIEEILDENSYDSPGDSVKKDFEKTLAVSCRVSATKKTSFPQKIMHAFLRLFAPLM